MVGSTKGLDLLLSTWGTHVTRIGEDLNSTTAATILSRAAFKGESIVALVLPALSWTWLEIQQVG